MADRTSPNRPRLSLLILGLASVLGVGLGAAIAVALHNPGAGTAIGTTLFVAGISYRSRQERQMTLISRPK